MANTQPQYGTTQASTGQQQAGVAPPQGPLGGLAYQAGHGSQTPQGNVAERIAQGAEQQAQRAIERVQHTREQALHTLESQQAQLGERIRDISGALRRSGQQLEQNDTAASLLSAAGDQVDRLASYVDTATPRSVASDLHNFARERPAWFFGGAFLVGLALGRFAKSSAEATSAGSYGQGPRWEQRTGSRMAAGHTRQPARTADQSPLYAREGLSGAAAPHGTGSVARGPSHE